MRTTIRLDDELLAAAKAYAAANRSTLSELVQEALQERLNRPEVSNAPSETLPVFDGNGLLPGVDLNDSANLLERMERGE